MSKKQKAAVLISVLIVLFGVVGLGFARAIMQEKNPPKQYKGVILGEEADQILRKSCFDCHSNETRWPWYSKLPVISNLIARDVKEGRKELNFSEWDILPANKKRKIIKEIIEETVEGEMPSYIYTVMHPEAAIGSKELAILKEQTAASYGVVADYKDDRDEGLGNNMNGGDDDDDHD